MSDYCFATSDQAVGNLDAVVLVVGNLDAVVLVVMRVTVAVEILVVIGTDVVDSVVTAENKAGVAALLLQSRYG